MVRCMGFEAVLTWPCSDSNTCLHLGMFAPSVIAWIADEKVAGETMQMLNHLDSHRYRVEI
jgi:hypothetical protein